MFQAVSPFRGRLNKAVLGAVVTKDVTKKNHSTVRPFQLSTGAAFEGFERRLMGRTVWQNLYVANVTPGAHWQEPGWVHAIRSAAHPPTEPPGKPFDERNGRIGFQEKNDTPLPDENRLNKS